MNKHSQSITYPQTLSDADIAALADKIEAAGNPGSYTDEFKAITGKLAYGDHLQLGHVLWLRDLERAIGAFYCDPVLQRWMFSRMHERGAKKPEACDLSYFAATSQRTTSQYHKPRAAWAAKGSTPLVMHLKQAVRVSYSQEAYADMSSVVVPCSFRDGQERELTEAEVKQCNANLGTFFQYGDTHTGLAGSGSNHSASLFRFEDKYFVLVSTRASIMD